MKCSKCDIETSIGCFGVSCPVSSLLEKQRQEESALKVLEEGRFKAALQEIVKEASTQFIMSIICKHGLIFPDDFT